MADGPSLVWFHDDLRLADHPALSAAVERGAPVIPVFIWSPDDEGAWEPGAASRWWLHQSLLSLTNSLKKRGSKLIIERGPTLEALRRLVRQSGAVAVFWNRRYEPALVERDWSIEADLRKANLHVETFVGNVLHEPHEIRTQEGNPYRVFTPYWRACRAHGAPRDPLPAPKHWSSHRRWPNTLKVTELGLEPKIDWAVGLRTDWSPGEAGARRQLEQFQKHALADYTKARNRPDQKGTSQLSPHLHFGEITPQQVWHALSANKQSKGLATQREKFFAELGWREFARHVLFHFPQTSDRPLREDFRRFPWHRNARALQRWQQGQTGFPIIDAGMRQLWTTGWMHNRVRMIVASFLTKDLLISWRRGAEWFWDTLVDADLANNTLGWQWTAGCGADAAPFFRIFNPTLQGKKFDPSGDYVRHWVPELAALPTKFLHEPRRASPAVLESCGIRLGKDYPEPLVDHREARQAALEAFASIRG